MDENLEQIVKIIGAGILASGLAAATVISSLYTAASLVSRKRVRDELIPLYGSGELETKPTIFNAYKLKRDVLNRRKYSSSE